MNIHKKFFSKIGVNYLIYGLAALIFQILVINIAPYVNVDLANDYNLFIILIAFCNYILPLPIILFLMKKIESRAPEKNGISVVTFLKYVCITLALMWAGNIFGLIITSLIGNAVQTSISNPVQNLINTAAVWLNLGLVSLIAPIFEEYVFRKLLVDRTIKYGAKVSIILSAVIFGFFHGNLNQFFYTFLMGGFLAYVYIKTGNIIYPIILHIIVNLMGSVISVFVAQSATVLVQGTSTNLDLAIIVIYIVMLLTVFLVGVISLLNYKKSKFKGSKTEIALAQPLKTMFLNPGMICFIGFYTLEIIYQIFI